MAKLVPIFVFLLGATAVVQSATTGGRAEESQNVVGSSCATSNGEEGTCVPFKKCYPLIYRFGSASVGVESNLMQDVLESTTPCSPKAATQRNKEDVVCCTTMKEKPASDVTIVEAFQSETDSEGESTPDPGIPSSCQGTKVVNFPDHFNTNAPKGAYPFMAALTSKGRQFCGGSVIDKSHILTAAHCVVHLNTPEKVSKVQIMLGATDLQAKEPERVAYGVSSIMAHGSYSDQNITNDVALIRLAKPIEFVNNIQPICPKRVDDGYSDGTKNATLAGWGRTSIISPGGSPQLRHVVLRVWNNTECAAKYMEIDGGDLPKVTENMVCAGSSGKDACHGDSGGPLFMKNGQSIEQIGIVSWGVGCGIIGVPAVYTRVDRYIDWIDENRQRKLRGSLRTKPEQVTSAPVEVTTTL